MSSVGLLIWSCLTARRVQSVSLQSCMLLYSGHINYSLNFISLFHEPIHIDSCWCKQMVPSIWPIAVPVLSFRVVGVNCPPLVVANAGTNTTNVAYDTYVAVSCNVGFEFNGDQIQNVTSCRANKTWLPLVTNCTRESIADFWLHDQWIFSTSRVTVLCKSGII